jgi:hypothetical protein
MPRLTPHQKMEKELTAFGLSFPETSLDAGWGTTRQLSVRRKGFAVFGGQAHKMDQGPDELSLIVKLPVAAEMVQELYYVMPAKGWFKQHNWVIAHFGPDDDVAAERDTLKSWLVQSYCAVTPKFLGRRLREQLGLPA